MRMKDKVGIVTAAGSGMGRAGALRFTREGAAVGVVDIDEKAAEQVVREITAAGGKARAIAADLRQDADSRRIVRETANAFGGLDFVWNHVGHPGPASVEAFAALRERGVVTPRGGATTLTDEGYECRISEEPEAGGPRLGDVVMNQDGHVGTLCGRSVNPVPGRGVERACIRKFRPADRHR